MMSPAQSPTHSPVVAVIAEQGICTGYRRALHLRMHLPVLSRVLPPLALYLHPGRFVSGGLEEADAAGHMFAARLGIAVVTPAYSLAAERPFPAAAEDVYAALVWAHDYAGPKRWDARRIAVVGEEAGGNLAAVVALMARDRGGPGVAAQVLIAPMLDPTLSTCSMRAADEMTARCGEAYRRYLPQVTDRMHPYAAPGLCTRLSGLAPALILTAEGDALREEGEYYGARLIAAGVKTQVTRLPAHGRTEAVCQEMAAFLGPLLALGHIPSIHPASESP